MELNPSYNRESLVGHLRQEWAKKTSAQKQSLVNDASSADGENSCQEHFGRTQENSPIKDEPRGKSAEFMETTESDEPEPSEAEISKRSRPKKKARSKEERVTNPWLVFRWKRFRELKEQKADSSRNDLMQLVKQEWAKLSKGEKEAYKTNSK